ncbi:NADP-dependent oxidoreductase [Acuticoccus sp.]|uniref:NADP-dependent oxidoreductase n=1 Tax=Acuticoccus sp. TaxID=1904378 RepID=UPI003B5241E3
MNGTQSAIVVERWTDTVASEENFVEAQVPVRTPEPGEFLVRVAYLSMDPSMRSYVHTVASFWPQVPPGDVMAGPGLGQVVESRAVGFLPGEYVYGPLGWREYATIPATSVQFRPDPAVAPLRAFMGVLGTTGVTAWCGIEHIADAGAGETVLVTTAAGAVGSVAVRLAKLRGARVVGVTGTDEKAAYLMEELGADAAINYRAGDLGGALAEAAPGGIDVFFDNVGGAQLDAGLRAMNRHGRIVVCGTISQPNVVTPSDGPRVERAILVKQLRLQGLLVSNYLHLHDRARRALAHRLTAGELPVRDDVLDGLSMAPRGLARVLTGENVGKQSVRVWDPANGP